MRSVPHLIKSDQAKTKKSITESSAVYIHVNKREVLPTKVKKKSSFRQNRTTIQKTQSNHEKKWSGLGDQERLLL